MQNKYKYASVWIEKETLERSSVKGLLLVYFSKKKACIFSLRQLELHSLSLSSSPHPNEKWSEDSFILIRQRCSVLWNGVWIKPTGTHKQTNSWETAEVATADLKINPFTLFWKTNFTFGHPSLGFLSDELSWNAFSRSILCNSFFSHWMTSNSDSHTSLKSVRIFKIARWVLFFLIPFFWVYFSAVGGFH